MNGAYLLTIAVPTYNRIRYLTELLPEICTQVEVAMKAGYPIEVLVSDNCSTDGTREMVEGLQRTWGSLTYVVNETNVGGDRNFLLCVERARGTYVWLFGDDEVLEKGALLRLCRILDDKKPELVIGSSSGAVDRFFTSYKQALQTVSLGNWTFSWGHSLITANIFKRIVFDVVLDKR